MDERRSELRDRRIPHFVDLRVRWEMCVGEINSGMLGNCWTTELP